MPVARYAGERDVPEAGGVDPLLEPGNETLDAYYAALGHVAELSVALLSAAARFSAVRGELRSAVARVRASVEAMPSGSQHTREAKDAFIAMLAAIEQRVGATVARPDDDRPSAPGTHGNDDATNTPCTDLWLFVDGELGLGPAAAFREHLDACEACRDDLVKAAQLAAQLTDRKEPT